MIGSATNLSAGKKLLGILVAIAMVLTMSNIAVWSADADETASGAKKIAVNEDGDNSGNEAEKAEEPPAAEKPAQEQPAKDEEAAQTPATDVKDTPSDEAADNSEGLPEDPSDENSPNQTPQADDEESEEAASSEPSAEADEAEEDEAIVDAPGTHSITVKAKIYQNGKFIRTVEGVESGSMSSKVSFDLRSFIRDARATGLKDSDGKTYALDKVDPEPPSDNTGIVLGPSHPSKLVIYKFDFASDELKDINNVQSNAVAPGDGIPDKYQKTITYKIQNGKWNSGYDPTEVVTFYNNGLSNAKNATGVLNLPSIDATPDPYFTESGSWDINVVEPVVTYGGASEFTYTFKGDGSLHFINARINYYLDGELDQTVTSNAFGSIEDDLTYDLDQRIFTIANPYRVPGNVIYDGATIGGTDLSKWNDHQKLTLPRLTPDLNLNEEIGSIDVYYSSDKMGPKDPNKSDGIRDKYQVKLNFEIKNGYLVNESEATKVYTLMKGGVPDETATLEINLPSSKPIEGHVKDAKKEYGGGWNDSRVTIGDRLKISKADDGLTLTNTFVRAPFAYTVYYFDDQTNLPILDAETYSARYLDKISASDHVFPINGYVFSYANIDELTVGSNSSDNGITLFFDADANEDGIADKYQVTVNYGAINGSIRGDYSEIVTLYDANGNPSVNGTGKLSHIPTFTPNAGFGNGTWSAEGQPTANTVITKNTNFVITYVANPPADEEEKGNNGGNRGNGGNNGNGNNEGNGGNVGNGGNTTYGPTEPGFVPYGPGDGTTAAVDEPEADATDETVEEEAIPEEENPLAEPEEQGAADDQQVITDGENALSDYAEESFNWVPIAIAAGIVIIGGLIFFAARKKRSESSAS